MNKNDNDTNGRATLRDLMAQQQEMRGEFNAGLTEVKSIVRDLAQNFQTLEAGRLTRLESTVSTLAATVASYEGKQTGSQYMIPILISVAIAVFSFFLNRLLP